MGYTSQELSDKLTEMYPEIGRNGIELDVEFDEGRDAWVISFRKGAHGRHAFLYHKDADACMEGRQCLYLGALIDQYVIDLEKEIGVLS